MGWQKVVEVRLILSQAIHLTNLIVGVKFLAKPYFAVWY